MDDLEIVDWNLLKVFRRLVGTVRINALRVNILENRPDLGTFSALAKITFNKDDKIIIFFS